MKEKKNSKEAWVIDRPIFNGHCQLCLTKWKEEESSSINIILVCLRNPENFEVRYSQVAKSKDKLQVCSNAKELSGALLL